MRRRRNAFARVTYVPERCPQKHRECDWCGQGPMPRRPLYAIRLENDSGRNDYLRGHFDSWQCAEAYHDGRIG